MVDSAVVDSAVVCSVADLVPALPERLMVAVVILTAVFVALTTLSAVSRAKPAAARPATLADFTTVPLRPAVCEDTVPAALDAVFEADWAAAPAVCFTVFIV